MGTKRNEGYPTQVKRKWDHDFIYEQSGYLALTDSEYKQANQHNPTFRKHARQWLEYGDAKEGYWTSDKFMKQIKEVAKIKFPEDAGWKVFWIFGPQQLPL